MWSTEGTGSEDNMVKITKELEFVFNKVNRTTYDVLVFIFVRLTFKLQIIPTLWIYFTQSGNCLIEIRKEN